MSRLFSFGDLQFSSSLENLLGSGKNVFKGTLKDKSVAVKKLSPNCTDIPQGAQCWEKLVKFRYEYLVPYYQCEIRDNVRYLVMELCQGSMLDYCRKITLVESVASNVKPTDVMWQITCAVDYLQRQKIDSGNLKLENVLFWKRDSKSKRVIVKITGYGYNYFRPKDKIDIIRRLGSLFYSADTRNESKPNGPIAPDSLTKIEIDQRAIALDLINFLINQSLSNNFEVGAVLRHPLFTRHSDEGRSRFIQDSIDNKLGFVWNDKEKLKKWIESADNEKFLGEEFYDFKDILGSENKDTLVHKILGEAFKTTPQLFSEYIWHSAIGSGEMRHSMPKNNQFPSIEIKEELGKGNYGKVYKCEYADGSGTRLLAACKKCNPKEGTEEVFKREIETLRKLNHSFVVKYLDEIEQDSNIIRVIVMELCDGSLKEYVDGKLEGVPKDSLDEKIPIGQIALGLEYIHDQKIIHKDLKLENILLKRQSPRLVLAKIADFGFAKEMKPGKSEFSETAHPETQSSMAPELLNATDDEFSKTKHPGTETYMAPELLNAKIGAYPNSFASDVYALGITIARIVLKGEHPFSNNNICRGIYMVKGLVPQNLQGLSWDLIDLILKLTDKDPGKRPEMFLVLRHPYFVLTNDKTKRNFTEEIWDGLESLPDEEKNKQLKKIFSSRNFREWYQTIVTDKPKAEKEIQEMDEILSFFRKLEVGVQAETLFPAKKYEQTIKEAIKSQYDARFQNKINQMFAFGQRPSSHLLHKLIQRAPNLFAPYLWTHLLDLMNHYKPIISELEWSSFYFDDEEVIDELWNIKFTKKYEDSLETMHEMKETAGKCNVSKEVWSALLDRMGIHAAAALLCKAVQSRTSNAPKVTEVILQRYGITERMAAGIHLTARNEGDWGAEILQIILKNGGNPNAIAPNGKNAVHYAAANESNSGPKMMKLLLENGGDPNAQPTNPNAFTPIHLAAMNQGDYAAEILKLLIDNGCACDAIVEIENEIYEPIHFATTNIGESASKLVDLLLKKRDIKSVNNANGLVYLSVINRGDCGTEILKKLLEKGMNPNISDDKKRIPLHYAATIKEYKNIATLKILLQNGSNPNLSDENGATPVHYAAANEGDEEALEKLKLLLAHGGKLDIKEKNGLTAVHAALLNIGTYGVEIRKLVGANEQNVNVPFNEKGETLLHMLCANAECKIEQVQQILANGGDPNAVDIFGRSPIHYAVIHNESNVGIEFLKLLLKKGGDANHIDEKNLFAPVHYAANSRKEMAPEQMKILLENGGDANAIRKFGTTPLHMAAFNSGIHGLKLTRILLEYGGNPNILNVNKCTPLHGAIANENDQLRLDIAMALLEKGANPNAGDKDGMTPVHYVIADERRNSLEVLKLLLKHGGNILQVDNNGCTPQRIATRMGNEKYCHPEVKKLIEIKLRDLFRGICVFIINRKEK